MVSKHMKRCSTSLTTGEMKFKTTMRYARMGVIKKTDNNKC